MKRTLLLIAALFVTAQAGAFESSNKEDAQQPKVEEKKKNISSESLYSDVECDMSDYTCYKVIIDLGRQEALAHILSDGRTEVSTVLKQAIQVYKNLRTEAATLSDEQIIYLLATVN